MGYIQRDHHLYIVVCLLKHMKNTPVFNKEGMKRMNINISEENWNLMNKIITSEKRESASEKSESFSSLIEICLDLSLHDTQAYIKMRRKMRVELIKNIRKSKGRVEADKAEEEINEVETTSD